MLCHFIVSTFGGCSVLGDLSEYNAGIWCFGLAKVFGRWQCKSSMPSNQTLCRRKRMTARWCVSYVEKCEMEVFRFLQCRFGILYRGLRFPIALWPVWGRGLKPYVFAKLWYSFEINCEPLFVRQRSGMPCRAKWALVRWMTVVAKVFGR